MPSKDFLLADRQLHDLNPLIAGEEVCAPGHSFGPAVRKYTLIHYVLQGKGVLYARGCKYDIHEGQAFIILPDEITTYTADKNDPWHYCWIGFNGVLSDRFSQLSPVVNLPETFFTRIIHTASQQSAIEYLLAADLFSLYAHLFTDQQIENPYVCRVENYIRSNYMHTIRVEKIAEELNLDRRYLSRLFKAKTGYSIQERLMKARVEEAERLLLLGCSVKEAARLTGYNDVSNFSKMFKKLTGRPPISVSIEAKTPASI